MITLSPLAEKDPPSSELGLGRDLMSETLAVLTGKEENEL